MEWKQDEYTIKVDQQGNFIAHEGRAFPTLAQAKNYLKSLEKNTRLPLALPCLLQDGTKAVLRSIHLQNGDFLVEGSPTRHSCIYPFTPWIQAKLQEHEQLLTKNRDIEEQLRKLREQFRAYAYRLPYSKLDHNANATARDGFLTLQSAAEKHPTP